ncbi:hypothetical protein E2C01_023291 [Portunus trituberculatus]|uniref:Uncharacterized protein n=1 Tax=Portunus trituberculatus TaxID=210409 RepID=A0A5B7E9L1_PORTR|nr:hypothetical protein [Portunus trituberculatus]
MDRTSSRSRPRHHSHNQLRNDPAMTNNSATTTTKRRSKDAATADTTNTVTVIPPYNEYISDMFFTDTF